MKLLLSKHLTTTMEMKRQPERILTLFSSSITVMLLRNSLKTLNAVNVESLQLRDALVARIAGIAHEIAKLNNGKLTRKSVTS